MPAGIVDALAARVQSVGFLPGGPSPRNEYRLVVDRPAEPGRGYREVDRPARSLHLVAANGPTVRAIGLNDARVWREDDRTLRYRVDFGDWLRRRVFVTGGLVFSVVALTLALDVSTHAGESYDLAALIGILMVGIFFPLLLHTIAMQKWRSERMLQTILTEELRRLQPIVSATPAQPESIAK
jgi:hypothetical protein